MERNHRSRRRVVRAITLVCALTAWLAAGTPVIQAQQQATGNNPAAGKEAVVTVKGMQCPFCAYGIKKHLAKIPGVKNVDVNLAKNEAIVQFAVDAQPTDAQIQQAVKNAGFTTGKIEWRTAPAGGSTDA